MRASMSTLPRSATVLLGVLTVGTLLTAGAAMALRRRGPAPPVLGEVPAFSLTDQSNRPVTRDSFRGQPWVADFIFTTCGSICPAMTTRMAGLRRELPAGTRLASFSVDPTTDTPERLADYARKFKAGPEWTFVTGAQKDLHRLANEGFKLPAAPIAPGTPGADGPFLHSPRFVLVDGDGHIRGYYDSTEPEDMHRLVKDARRIAD
jgi:protein SCO1